MNIQERRNHEGKITSYRIRVYDHRDPATGKQVFRSFSVKYDSEKSESWNRKNAEKKGFIFEDSIRHSIAEYSNTTFDVYCRYALQVKERGGISPSTKYSYGKIIERIAPYLGYFRLKMLSPSIINRAYDRMLSDGISPSSIYQFHLLIHSILEMAYKEGLIPRNYADAAIPPKHVRKEASALSEKEITAFFNALYYKKDAFIYQVLFTLLLATGCRIGELCALTWDDVDLGADRIHICRHFTFDEGSEKVVDGGKTASSERWIYMSAETMDLLRAYREYYLKVREKHSKEWKDDVGAVFFSERKRGVFLRPSAVRQWLRVFTRENGLPDIHPHMFRHTAVSLQLQAGISIADAAKRAGHSRPDVTLRIYSHMLKENDSHCCEAVMKYLPKLPE